MARKKIALIGGGQIGGNLALLATQKELGDVVIYDIPQAEGITKGKSLDIMQLRPHDGYDANLEGTSDPAYLSGSDVVIITAGVPRKPGMDREDLLEINIKIITDVANNVKKYAPNAFVIVVSNPLDAIVERVRFAGGEIVKLFGNGSAYYAPAASAIEMAEAYLKDKKRVIPSAALCEGEFGVDGYFIGVPTVIGAGGIEKILEFKLLPEEQEMLNGTLEAVKNTVAETKL